MSLHCERSWKYFAPVLAGLPAETEAKRPILTIQLASPIPIAGNHTMLGVETGGHMITTLRENILINAILKARRLDPSKAF